MSIEELLYIVLLMKKSPPVWLKKIKLIAWDLDGTLYPPLSKVTDEIDQARITTIAQHLKISTDEAQQKFAKMYAQLHSTTEVLNKLGIEGEQFFIDFWDSFDLSKYIDPDPQLKKMFIKLKEEGREHALLTNANTQESVREKLKATGLSSDLFSAIFASGRTGIHKPAPEAFAQLWEQTPFTIEQIVYLGDKENTDIVPAKKLGLKTVLMDWWGEATTTQADLIVRSPRDFLKMF
ncbi:MAG: HAD family hydrolase [Candidatus Paceibacterota bacterium]